MIHINVAINVLKETFLLITVSTSVTEIEIDINGSFNNRAFLMSVVYLYPVLTITAILCCL
jgi:hypothetical protein